MIPIFLIKSKKLRAKGTISVEIILRIRRIFSIFFIPIDSYDKLIRHIIKFCDATKLLIICLSKFFEISSDLRTNLLFPASDIFPNFRPIPELNFCFQHLSKQWCQYLTFGERFPWNCRTRRHIYWKFFFWTPAREFN